LSVQFGCLLFLFHNGKLLLKLKGSQFEGWRLKPVCRICPTFCTIRRMSANQVIGNPAGAKLSATKVTAEKDDERD
jgi:hypothetical protein